MFSWHTVTKHRQLNIPYPTDIAPIYLFISHSQYKAFRIACFVAPFSFLGSLAIIYRILRIDRYDSDAAGRRTYHRLLVAMSICDVFGSVAFAFGPTPVPKELLFFDARGTTATCTAQGFALQWFAVAVLYYNTGLMIYFVMTIRYGWSEARVAKTLEPIIHIWAQVVPLAQAVAGLFLDIFHPVEFGNICHIARYPPLCEVFNACTRGKQAKLLYTLFNTVPESILVAVIYISIALIYCTVRHQARRELAITVNQQRVRAKIKMVAVQSWLFAFVFFLTWFFAGPLLGVAFKPLHNEARVQYIAVVLVTTLLPLQGFLNFCIYIRPRFVRLRAERDLSSGKALVLAVFGGRDTNSPGRRFTILQRQAGFRTLVETPPQVSDLSSGINLSRDGEVQNIESQKAENDRSNESLPVMEPNAPDSGETSPHDHQCTIDC